MSNKNKKQIKKKNCNYLAENCKFSSSNIENCDYCNLVIEKKEREKEEEKLHNEFIKKVKGFRDKELIMIKKIKKQIEEDKNRKQIIKDIINEIKARCDEPENPACESENCTNESEYTINESLYCLRCCVNIRLKELGKKEIIDKEWNELW